MQFYVPVKKRGFFFFNVGDLVRTRREKVNERTVALKKEIIFFSYLKKKASLLNLMRCKKLFLFNS